MDICIRIGVQACVCEWPLTHLLSLGCGLLLGFSTGIPGLLLLHPIQIKPLFLGEAEAEDQPVKLHKQNIPLSHTLLFIILSVLV